jgi:hypothetical protein
MAQRGVPIGDEFVKALQMAKRLLELENKND